MILERCWHPNRSIIIFNGIKLLTIADKTMIWQPISLYPYHYLLITNSTIKTCYAQLCLPITIPTAIGKALYIALLELSNLTAHLFFWNQIKW